MGAFCASGECRKPHESNGSGRTCVVEDKKDLFTILLLPVTRDRARSSCVALQAVDSLGVSAEDLGPCGHARVASGTVLTHEVTVRRDGRGVRIQPFAFPKLLRPRPEVVRNELLLGRLKDMTLLAAGLVTDTGCLEVRVRRSEADAGHLACGRGVASGAGGTERRMGDHRRRAVVGPPLSAYSRGCQEGGGSRGGPLAAAEGKYRREQQAEFASVHPSHPFNAHSALLVIWFLADVVHRVQGQQVDELALVKEGNEDRAPRRSAAAVYHHG